MKNFNTLKENICEDLKINFQNTKKCNILKRWSYDKMKFLFFMRLSAFFINYQKPNIFIKFFKIIFLKLWQYYGKKLCIEIRSETAIGKGLRLPHPIGIVINSNVKIGDNCSIFQNVTLGSNKHKKDTPIICNNVTIYAGAVIVGGGKSG
jgi:serine O-acetyltransferase